MILQSQDLLELYEAVVKPFGHPDPLGYMTRAIIFSGGDPDFVEGDKIGFLPVNPATALELVGSEDVTSLEGNVTTTLAIDRLNFDNYKSIGDMILSFHFEDFFSAGDYTSEQVELLDEIDDSRSEMNDLIYPPFATVQDVINVLKGQNDDVNLTKQERDFFKFLVREK